MNMPFDRPTAEVAKYFVVPVKPLAPSAARPIVPGAEKLQKCFYFQYRKNDLGEYTYVEVGPDQMFAMPETGYVFLLQGNQLTDSLKREWVVDDAVVLFSAAARNLKLLAPGVHGELLPHTFVASRVAVQPSPVGAPAQRAPRLLPSLMMPVAAGTRRGVTLVFARMSGDEVVELVASADPEIRNSTDLP